MERQSYMLVVRQPEHMFALNSEHGLKAIIAGGDLAFGPFRIGAKLDANGLVPSLDFGYFYAVRKGQFGVSGGAGIRLISQNPIGLTMGLKGCAYVCIGAKAAIHFDAVGRNMRRGVSNTATAITPRVTRGMFGQPRVRIPLWDAIIGPVPR